MAKNIGYLIGKDDLNIIKKLPRDIDIYYWLNEDCKLPKNRITGIYIDVEKVAPQLSHAKDLSGDYISTEICPCEADTVAKTTEHLLKFLKKQNQIKEIVFLSAYFPPISYNGCFCHKCQKYYDQQGVKFNKILKIFNKLNGQREVWEDWDENLGMAEKEEGVVNCLREVEEALEQIGFFNAFTSIQTTFHEKLWQAAKKTMPHTTLSVRIFPFDEIVFVYRNQETVLGLDKKKLFNTYDIIYHTSHFFDFREYENENKVGIFISKGSLADLSESCYPIDTTIELLALYPNSKIIVSPLVVSNVSEEMRFINYLKEVKHEQNTK